MRPVTAERRSTARASVAHPVLICNRRGRVLGRGRTGNISENGVFVVVPEPGALARSGQLVIRIELPSTRQARNGRNATRQVSYLARVVHSQSLGQMLGLGLEFLQKLD